MAGPQQTALAALSDGLQQARGIVVLTGDPGVGKTAVVDALLSTMEEAEVLLVRPEPGRIKADGLLRSICGILDIDAGQSALLRSDLEMRAGLEAFLGREIQAGRPVLLVLDEAQVLPGSVYDELGWVAGLRWEGWPLVHCLLSGPPQLPERMAIRGLEAANGTVGAIHHLEPLGAEETRGYIEHRLAIAGWDGDPRFTAAAYRSMHRTARGLPQSVNHLCHRVLEAAYAQRRHEVDADLVEAVREGRIRPLDETPGAVAAGPHAAGIRAEPGRRTAERRRAAGAGPGAPKRPRTSPAQAASGTPGRGWQVAAAVVLCSLSTGVLGYFARDRIALRDPDTRVGQLTRNLEQKGKALETARAEATRQGNALRATAARRQQIESELAALGRERDRLAATLAELETAVADARAGEDAARREQTKGAGDAASLRDQVARLTGERDALQADLATALGERAALEAEVAALSEAPRAPAPAGGIAETTDAETAAAEASGAAAPGAAPEAAPAAARAEAPETTSEESLASDVGRAESIDPKIVQLAERVRLQVRPAAEPEVALTDGATPAATGSEATANEVTASEPAQAAEAAPEQAPQPALAAAAQAPAPESNEGQALREPLPKPLPEPLPERPTGTQTAALPSSDPTAYLRRALREDPASVAASRRALSGPGEFLEHLGSRVAALYRGGEYPPEERKRRLRGLLHESVDLSDFSESILGTEWQAASKPERAEYLSLIEGHLFNPLINILESDGVRDLTVLGTVEEGGGVASEASLVTTRLETGAGDFHELGWEVRPVADGFRAVDLRSQGVSLLTIFQSELRSYVALNGAGALLQTLRARSSAQTSERPVDDR